MLLLVLSKSGFAALLIESSPQSAYWAMMIGDHCHFPGSGQVQPWQASRLQRTNVKDKRQSHGGTRGCR
jgi:hypothetical protein